MNGLFGLQNPAMQAMLAAAGTPETPPPPWITTISGSVASNLGGLMPQMQAMQGGLMPQNLGFMMGCAAGPPSMPHALAIGVVIYMPGSDSNGQQQATAPNVPQEATSQQGQAQRGQQGQEAQAQGANGTKTLIPEIDFLPIHCHSTIPATATTGGAAGVLPHGGLALLSPIFSQKDAANFENAAPLEDQISENTPPFFQKKAKKGTNLGKFGRRSAGFPPKLVRGWRKTQSSTSPGLR